MRKGILIFLLAAMNGGAMAEWVLVRETEQVKGYADTIASTRNGEMAKMWVLYDFKENATFAQKMHSMKAQNEFDCVKERARILAITQFSGQMGNGEAIYSGAGAGDWEPVRPETLGSDFFKLACTEKKK